MSGSPWSWQPPPLPISHSIVGSTTTRREATWYRRLWALEANFGLCYFALPGMTDIILSQQITPPANAKRPIDISLVRSVVRSFRFDHPNIAARFAWPQISAENPPNPDEGLFVYEVPSSEDEVEQWLSKVVIDRSCIASPGTSLDSAVSTVTNELGKVATGYPTTLFEICVISTPSDQNCALVFRLSHALFDGIGAFQLLDKFNTKLATHLNGREVAAFRWGEEVSRLAGAVPDRAKVPWSPKKIEEDGVMLKRLGEALEANQRRCGLPVPYPTANPSTTGVFTRSLSPEKVSGLRLAARRHGCTVFNVLFSAMTLCVLRVNPPKRTDLVFPIFPSAVDLRARYLARDADGNVDSQVAGACGFHMYIAENLERFIRSTSFDGPNPSAQSLDDLWTLAKEIHDQTEEQRQYMDRAGFWVHEMMTEILSAFTAAASATHSDAGPPPDPVPNISSLGIVDPYFAASHDIPSGGTLHVAQPRFSVRMPYTPYFVFPVVFHPYTWQGKMYISFSFPESYMGSAREQEKALEEGRKADAPALNWVTEFMDIVNRAADSD